MESGRAERFMRVRGWIARDEDGALIDCGRDAEGVQKPRSETAMCGVQAPEASRSVHAQRFSWFESDD